VLRTADVADRVTGTDRTSDSSLWQQLRYGALLRAAGTSVAAARAYAAVVAEVERRRDPHRSSVAEARIRRSLGMTGDAARRIYRDALYSEALEEADSLRFMSGRSSIARDVDVVGVAPRGGGPRLYAALHFGSPVLAYLALRAVAEPDLLLIGRELDEEKNPMPASKREFAARKVAWVEAAGAPFLGTTDRDVLQAREHLLAGRPLCAAVDVPGNVVRRAEWIDVAGHRVSVATGVLHLAVLTGCDVQLVAGAHRAGRISVWCRPAFSAPTVAELARKIAADVDAVVREWPGEWWMWPFMVAPREERGFQ